MIPKLALPGSTSRTHSALSFSHIDIETMLCLYQTETKAETCYFYIFKMLYFITLQVHIVNVLFSFRFFVPLFGIDN